MYYKNCLFALSIPTDEKVADSCFYVVYKYSDQSYKKKKKKNSDAIKIVLDWLQTNFLTTSNLELQNMNSSTCNMLWYQNIKQDKVKWLNHVSLFVEYEKKA